MYSTGVEEEFGVPWMREFSGEGQQALVYAVLYDLVQWLQAVNTGSIATDLPSAVLVFPGLCLNCRNCHRIDNIWNCAAAAEVIDGFF
ncbi:MAG: hypothetical protein OHK0047_32320 [Leptolyngbyaceae cyanobacterium]